MKLRHTLTATTLAVALLTLGACSRLAGAPAALPTAGSAVPAVTVTVTSSATVTSPTTAVSQQSTHTPTPEDASTTLSTTHISAPADAATIAWVGSTCTGMGNVLNELVNDKPQLDDDASVGTLRQAMVDYYALSTKTVDAAYTASQAVQPPHVADGAAIHQAYQHFLSGLGDIFYNAALDMSSATDLTGVEKVNDGVDQHITTLGSDNAALQAMSTGPLADIAKNIPACTKVADLATGT